MGKHPVMRFLVALQKLASLKLSGARNTERSRLIEIDQKNAILFTRSRQSFTTWCWLFPSSR